MSIVRDLDVDDALLRSALDYAARGWRVTPLHDVAGGACSCGKPDCDRSAGKHPRMSKWGESATTDEATIRGWFTKWPPMNFGIATGPESGIWVLDVEAEGLGTLETLERENKELPKTFTVQSGGGGKHFYFRWPTDGTVIPSRNVPCVAKIDTRGAGGQIVGPGSRSLKGEYSILADEPAADAPEWLIDLVARMERPSASFTPALQPSLDVGDSDRVRRARAYLEKIPGGVAGNGGSNPCLWAASVLVWGYCLDRATARELMAEYSARCSPPWSEREIEHKLDDAAKGGIDKPLGWLLDAARPDRIAAPSARRGATTATETPPATPNDAVDDPHRLAGAYLAATADVLRHWRGEWHRWHGGAYRPMTDDDMRARITEHIRAEFVHAGETEPVDDDKGPRSTRKVSTRIVGDTLNALVGMAHIGDAIDAPAWIDGEKGPDPAALIVTRSGILDVAAWADGRPDYLRPLTPALWTPTALPFAFAADAPKPERWLAFLGQLWPDDPASIACLQEWMGYLLTPDTRQQKILFLLGPKRAGKGVITRMITALVGEENRAGPTLGSLTTNFGLSALLGKTVATISDARLSGRADSAVVVERLLSISGEDALSVDRKHREPITARLSARFVIASNELPRLGDASGALAGRLILLRFTRTFFNTEDSDFERKLQPELPGILLWALDGLRRLRARGRFVQPESGGKLVREMEDLGSPVGAFVREKCVIESGASVPVPELYAEYRRWCEQHGRKDIQNEENFGRDLRAAIPELERVRRRQGTERWYAYTPLRLRRIGDPEAEEGHLVPRGRSDLPLVALQKSGSEEIEKEWEGRCDLRGPMDLTAPPPPSGPPPSTGRRYGAVNGPGQAKGGAA